MEFIKCKNCGKEISKKASICTHCGVKTHPIRDIVKIVVIVLCVLISLVLIGYIIPNGIEFIQDKQLEKKYNKIIGTYELQADNNTIEFNDRKLTFDKTMNITSVNRCEAEDKTCVNYDEVVFEDKLIRTTMTFYDSNNYGTDIIICFELDNDILKQTPCPSNYYGLSLEEMNITYKRVK